jgi:hypothetical protein
MWCALQLYEHAYYQYPPLPILFIIKKNECTINPDKNRNFGNLIDTPKFRRTSGLHLSADSFCFFNTFITKGQTKKLDKKSLA